MSLVNTSTVAGAVPFDNSTNLFTAGNVQTAIEEVKALINPSVSSTRIIYVNKGGNDTTGTGSIGLPYLTIGKALTVILDAAPTNKYLIDVGPGDYNESLSYKANIFIRGAGPIATRITGATANINDATWNVTSADNRSGFIDLSLNSACTWDFSAQANNTDGKLYFFNIRTSGAWTSTANSSITQVIIHDSQIFGAWTQSGCNAFISASTFQGTNITVNSAATSGQGAAILTLIGGRTTGNITATWASNGAVTANLAGIAIGSTTVLTASGTSCTVNANIDSIPVPTNRSITSGAILNRFSIPDLGMFGDGSDGDVSLSSGTTTLTRTMYYNNLTLSSTAVINTSGYKIYVRNSLTMSGTSAISNDGGAGGNASGNTVGTAGTAAIGIEVGSGQAGLAGVTQMTNGSSPAATTGYGASGGSGGNGGQNGTGTPGGTGAAGGVLTHTPERVIRHDHWISATSFKSGGAGGGAGGGGQPSLFATAGASGGSGAGGGVVVVFAVRINNTSSVGITARGGKGGNGGNATSGNSGGGAGSGGGGGGQVYLVTIIATAIGTLNVSGGALGTGGTQSGTGAVGANGVAGSTGRTTTYNLTTDVWTVT